MSPFLQRTPLSSSQRSRWSTPSAGGRVGRTCFRGSCQRGSCSSHGGLHFHRWRGGHKGPRGGFGGPQGGLDDSLHRGAGGEVVRLEGEKEGAPVQFPPDRRPAKPLEDASCCASMQRSVASADIIVMEGWGRKG